MVGKVLESTESKGSREPPCAEEGRMAVRAEIGEGQIGKVQDSPPSSNLSDGIGGAAARLASCSGQRLNTIKKPGTWGDSHNPGDPEVGTRP